MPALTALPLCSQLMQSLGRVRCHLSLPRLSMLSSCDDSEEAQCLL